MADLRYKSGETVMLGDVVRRYYKSNVYRIVEAIDSLGGMTLSCKGRHFKTLKQCDPENYVLVRRAAEEGK